LNQWRHLIDMSKGIFHKNIMPLADRMYRYAYSMLHSNDLAQDVVQDSLMRIWDKRKTLTSIQKVDAWAMRIVRNGCLDYIRRNKFTAFEESHENKLFVNSGDNTSFSDQKNWFEEAVKSLPEKQHEVFHLREVECMSYREISEIMGIGESDVKVNLHRARNKVRETMKKVNDYGTNRVTAG